MINPESLTHEGAFHPHPDRDNVIPGPTPPLAPPLVLDRKARRTLSRMNAADLMSKVFPPQKFVVDGLLPVGLSMLVGGPKLGKSWASLDLALSVASGRSFLNRETDQGAVLYLALEDTPRRLKERLNIIGPHADWENLPLDMWLETDAIDAGGLEDLRGWLTAAVQPRLIIIDIWGRFDSTVSTQKNEYDRLTQTLQPLQALAGEFDVAILLIHHTKKGTGEASTSNDPFDQVLGSRALTSNMDQTMLLTRTRMQRDAVLSITGRDIEETQIHLNFDKETCRWRVTDHASGPMFTPEKQLVLDAVSEGISTAATIAEHLGKSRTSVANHLTDLVKGQHLERLTGGRYGLPGGDAQEATGGDVTDQGDSGDWPTSDPLI